MSDELEGKEMSDKTEKLQNETSGSRQVEPLVSRNQEEVTAEWFCDLRVECPYCDGYIDVMELPEYDDGLFETLHPLKNVDDLDAQITCPECGGVLVITKTVY